MELILLEKAIKDRDYWKKTGNVQIMRRISLLLGDIMAHPFTGIGKPGPLRHDLQGKWSRRITREHRLIYSVSDGRVFVYVFSMRDHY